MIGLVSKSRNYLKEQRHFDVYKAKGSDNQDQMERIVSAVVNLAIERMETQNFTRLWFWGYKAGVQNSKFFLEIQRLFKVCHDQMKRIIQKKTE